MRVRFSLGRSHTSTFFFVDDISTLEIKEEDVYNYFTLISKYRYDMSSVEHDQLAVRYKAKVPSAACVASRSLRYQSAMTMEAITR